MKTYILLLFIVLSNVFAGIAQTIEYPDFKSSDDHSTVISKIERLPKYTIVTFEHTNNAGAWVTLNTGMYLQDYDGQAIFKFVRAENIPLHPEKYQFKNDNEKKVFKVYFEKLPANIKKINIIERAVPKDEPIGYFNFFRVSLEKSGKGRINNGGYKI